MRFRSWISVLLLAISSTALAQTKVIRHETTIKQPDARVSRVSVKTVRRAKVTRLESDVSRLESILITTQNANLPSSSLRPAANEANMLANRIWADVHHSYRGKSTAIKDATQLRMHIREMHAAAVKRDTAGVQMHAKAALPFAYRIDDLL